MRGFAILAALAALVACSPQAERPHTQQQWSACTGETFGVDQATACGAVIADDAADPMLRAEALVQRGVLRADAGEYARAVADFGRALRLNPQSVAAITERGYVHSDRGAHAAALRDFDAALALAPYDASATRGRELALQGRTDAVTADLAALTEALAETPRDAALLNNRCWVRAVAGRELEVALADCNAALLIEPGNANALDSRALVHLKRGALDDALRDYEAALALTPNEGHYLYGRGLVRRARGMNAEAEADFTAAERVRPGVAELYRSYGL